MEKKIYNLKESPTTPYRMKTPVDFEKIREKNRRHSAAAKRKLFTVAVVSIFFIVA